MILITKPFHLSIVVPDLELARSFYCDLLGCQLGRDTGQWIDVLFFGHQLTIHQEGEGRFAKPIDHFGPILYKEQWQNIHGLLSSNNRAFEMRPFIKNVGKDSESGKFIVKDPAGNILEFKYYKNFSTTFEKAK